MAPYRNAEDSGLRRSARLKRARIDVDEPAMVFMKEEKFDALIADLQRPGPHCSRERQFKMPNHILLQGAKKMSETISVLEDLHQEIFLKVVSRLDDPDRISLSLTSKTMAYKVEGCHESRIANLRWVSDSPFRSAIPRANRRLVAQLLAQLPGQSKYEYCNWCEKFRRSDEAFWYELFKYKSPSIEIQVAIQATKNQMAQDLNFIKDQPAMKSNIPANIKKQYRFLKKKLEWRMSPYHWSDKHICPGHVYPVIRKDIDKSFFA